MDQFNVKKKLFSSPERKTEVTFSDQNLYVAYRRRCRCCRHRRRRRRLNLCIFSSSLEPLGFLQTNLLQSIFM